MAGVTVAWHEQERAERRAALDARPPTAAQVAKLKALASKLGVQPPSAPTHREVDRHIRRMAADLSAREAARPRPVTRTRHALRVTLPADRGGPRRDQPRSLPLVAPDRTLPPSPVKTRTFDPADGPPALSHPLELRAQGARPV